VVVWQLPVAGCQLPVASWLPCQALIKLKRRRLSAPQAAAQSDMQNIFEITQP